MKPLIKTFPRLSVSSLQRKNGDKDIQVPGKCPKMTYATQGNRSDHLGKGPEIIFSTAVGQEKKVKNFLFLPFFIPTTNSLSPKLVPPFLLCYPSLLSWLYMLFSIPTVKYDQLDIFNKAALLQNNSIASTSLAKTITKFSFLCFHTLYRRNGYFIFSWDPMVIHCGLGH